MPHVSRDSRALLISSKTQTNQAVFTLQSAIGDLFREYLSSHGFMEIHSPKLQGAATESGASVFKVNYFKGRNLVGLQTTPLILR